MLRCASLYGAGYLRGCAGVRIENFGINKHWMIGHLSGHNAIMSDGKVCYNGEKTPFDIFIAKISSIPTAFVPFILLVKIMEPSILLGIRKGKERGHILNNKY